MITIREGTFETNSSSTHSLCIAKNSTEKDWNIPNYINITYDDYGWRCDALSTVDEKVCYLATAMKELELEAEFEDFVDKLVKLGIKVHVKKYDESYVDHCYELIEFIHDILQDDDKFKRFLFDSRSAVYTGNDNGCDEDNMCFCAYEDVWVEKDGADIMIPNPNHDEDNFEYYFKGN